MRRHTSAITALLCLAAGSFTPTGILSAGEADPLARVLAATTAELDARLKAAGQAREYVLQLEDAFLFRGHYVQRGARDGVVDRAMVLRLVREGQGWSGVEVGTDSPPLARRLLVTGCDATGLTLAGEKIGGKVIVTVGRQSRGREMDLGENAHSMSKAGRANVCDWTIGGMERVEPAPQEFTIAAAVLPGVTEIELTACGLVGEPREADPPGADDGQQVSWEEVQARLPRSRGDLQLRLRHGPKGWSADPAFAPEWNRGIHQVDAAGLSLDGGRLTGELVVTLNPDPWVPKPSVPRRLVLAVDLAVRHGLVRGTAAVSGDQGAYEVQLTGSVWQAVAGTYTGHGVDGPRQGEVRGRVRSFPAAAADHPGLCRAAQPGGDELARLLDGWCALNGLVVAHQRHPLPVDVDAANALRPELPVGDLATWRQVLAAWATQAAGYATTPPARGNAGTEDPEFGPFCVKASLAAAEGGHALPATGDAAWYTVDRWKGIGPFVARRGDPQGPTALPAVLPVEGVCYRDWRRNLERDVSTDLGWRDLPPGEQVSPPKTDWDAIWIDTGKMSSYSTHPLAKAYRACEAGSRRYDWYAATTITADRAGEAWIAIQANVFGQVWIDGRLVWESGERYDPWLPAIFQVSLAAGPNTVLVKCGQPAIGYHPPGVNERSNFRCWLSRGTPRDGDEATLARVELVTARTAREAPRAHGYHAPGTRVAPAAEPPLAWDVRTDVNVRWRRQLPVAAASPVVDDGRVYVTSEPHTLTCLDAVTGELRWSDDANLLLLAEDAAVRAAPEKFSGFVAAARQRAALVAETGPLKRALKEEGADQASVQARLDDIEARIKAWDREWAGVMKLLEAQGIAVSRKDASIGSRAGAVPIVRDGRLWVSYGTGVVARYDAEGKRLAMANTGRPWTGDERWSPCLVGDRLYQLAPKPRERGDTGPAFFILALDAESLATVWRSEPLDGVPGGMAPVVLTGEKPGRSAVLLALADGRIVQVAGDGQDVKGTVINDGVVSFLRPGVNGTVPYVVDDTLFYTAAAGQAAVRLWFTADGIACRQLWDFHRNGHDGSLPVFWQDRLYVPRCADEFHPHSGVVWDQLDVYDAGGGHHLAKPKPVVREGMTPGPAVIAGRHVVYTEVGGERPFVHDPAGHLVFLDANDRPFAVMDNAFPKGSRIHGSPVCVGPRLYVRVDDEVLCLEAADDAGRAYVARELARTVLRFVGDRPPQVQPAEPRPLAEPAGEAEAPISVITPGVGAASWLTTGPLPLSKEPLLTALGGPERAVVTRGTQFALGERTVTFGDIPPEALASDGSIQTSLGSGVFYTRRLAVDFLALMDRKPGTSFLYTVLRNDEPRVMLFNLRGLMGQAWLGGVPIEDGTAVRLQVGDYPLLMRLNLTSVPPVGKPVIRMNLVNCDDPLAALKVWKEKIATHRERLEQVKRDLPGDPLALLATRLLEEL